MRIIAIRTTLLAAALLAAAPYAGAQTATEPVAPKAKPAERAAATPGQPTNVRIDLTITDQTGPGEPIKKVVTMLLADAAQGSIRSSGSVRGQGRVQINLDARANVLPSGHIRLSLGLEYNPRVTASDSPTESSSLNEQIAVLLEPGKPLVVSQAADPASDRKISVEVKATVLK